MDQRQAQKRVAAIAGFRDELRRLVDLGLVKISTEERRGIEAYHDEVLADLATLYDVDTSGAQARLSWGMRIASTFGAIALSIAVLLAVAWPAGVALCATWLLVAAVTRYSSLAALVSFVLSPAYAWFLIGDLQRVEFAALLAGLVVLRHKSNIQRLLRGEESKIGASASNTNAGKGDDTE